MEFLLLLGLIVLAVRHQRLAVRFAALRREVEALRDMVEQDGDGRPALEERRPAARVVRSVAEPAPAPPPEAPPRSARAALLGAAPAATVEAPDPGGAPENAGALFERLVGGKLLIWIGGIALALAGMFLVRHSIQIGLITPGLRMLLAAAFGLVLIGAGEYARSRPDGAVDPRVGQALVGAGVLVLYTAAYGAHVLYGLVGMRTASALMVAVTIAALVLSLRHGAPAAVMGLVGGFATPALVGSNDSGAIPLLTYLSLLNLAVFALAVRRGWTWLAASAVLLSFGWSGFLLVAPPDHALAAGVFILALGIAASLARAGGGWHLDFLRPAGIGLVQLAVLVGRIDLGLPAWGLYALLSAATFFLARRRRDYRLLPAVALALALVLLTVKAVDSDPLLPWAALGIAILFSAGALPGALRGASPLVPTVIASLAVLGPAFILRLATPGLLEPSLGGLLLLAAASVPLLLGFARSGKVEADGLDRPMLVAAGSAMLLLMAAAIDLVPRELVGSLWLATAFGAAVAARRLADKGLSALALASGVAGAAWAAAMVPELWLTLGGAATGEPALLPELPPLGAGLLVLAPAAALLIAIGRVLPPLRGLASVPVAGAAAFAAAAAYILYKQIFALGDAADFAARGLAERTLLNQLLFLLGWLVCTGRLPVPGLPEERRWHLGILLTAIAAARLFWFDMVVHNPLMAAQDVGRLPVLNLILPTYLLSAFWLYKARRGADNEARSTLWLALFLAALAFGTMLMVRQLFQGPVLSGGAIPATESYGYSLAGLLLSIGLLLSGIRLPDKALRLAGLLLLTLTILKVFLADAAALEGVLRILSFLGLGIALIGIGKLYATVLRAEAARPRPPAPLPPSAPGISPPL